MGNYLSVLAWFLHSLGKYYILSPPFGIVAELWRCNNYGVAIITRRKINRCNNYALQNYGNMVHRALSSRRGVQFAAPDPARRAMCATWQRTGL